MKELRIEAEIENLDKVLAFIDEELEKVGCDITLQMQIDVAVEEMYVNIASYAYAPGSGMADISFELLQDPAAVQIVLRDSGVAFDPLAKPDPDVTLSAEERQIGGLGIYMVKKTMDKVNYEYTDGQNVFTMYKKLS